MKVLGIDYGEKRIGLALSDESRTLARELTVVSPKEFWDQIPAIIDKNQISQIVLGWPLNMDGGETRKTQEVQSFKLKVERMAGIKVETIDERLTSQMAEKLPGGEQNADSLAAQIILQNYLNKIKT
jgi:putative Holliday junction resolvase